MWKILKNYTEIVLKPHNKLQEIEEICKGILSKFDDIMCDLEETQQDAFLQLLIEISKINNEIVLQLLQSFLGDHT